MENGRIQGWRRRKWAVASAGFVLVGAAALTAGFHGHQTPHKSVAPWDYPDQPNPVKIANPGAVMPDPQNVVHAKNNVATTPDGITIRLNHIDKGNTSDWKHWWTPDGAPLSSRPADAMEYPMPETAPLANGRVRALAFSISIPDPQDVEYIGYVPDGARTGLTSQEQFAHGWDAGQGFMPGSTHQETKAQVTVDDLNASRFMFGLATGPWTPVATAKNPLTTGGPDGQVIATGPWGTARFAKRPHGGVEFASKSIGGISIELIPPSEPVNQALRIRAFDASGNEINTYTRHNSAFIMGTRDPKPIASFAIEARPYVYYEFDGIHYDPDPKLWSEFAWGTDQPALKTQAGDVTAELDAVIETQSEAGQYGGPARYVGTRTYTIENKVWRDSPYADNVGAPATETFPKFNPKTGKFDPPTPLPKPLIAMVKLHWNKELDAEPPVGRMTVFGSDSPKPGVDLHQDWNTSLLEWRHYGELLPLPTSISVPFSLKPQASYVQIQLQTATGPFKKLLEVKLDPEEIKPQGANYRKFSLQLGPKVSLNGFNPPGKWAIRNVSDMDLTSMDTRVYARMKDGKRMLLKLTSYYSSGPNTLYPCFDFDRDATETEGDVIALPQIDAFEIEGRPVKEGYLVYKKPDWSKD